MSSMEEAVHYNGVRKRKWGKWVSEIREPGKKTRIWLGSFESPEMAAVAHDVAAFRLQGPKAKLNFPQSVEQFPRPQSSNAKDIRSAALEAASLVRLKQSSKMARGDSEHVRLDRDELELEFDLDSHKMWTELAEALLLAPPPPAWSFGEAEEEGYWNEGGLWDLFT